MPTQRLTIPAAPPTQASPASFSPRGDEFLAAVARMATEMTALGTALSGSWYPPTLRNRLINGAFDFWQRGTSHNATTSAYGSADRWSLNATYSATLSRQAFTLGQTAVPGEPEFFARVTFSTPLTGDFVVLSQRVEDARTFSNTRVTLSFWAKADATKAIAVGFQQFGGSTVIIAPQRVTLTTTWTRYVLSFDIPAPVGLLPSASSLSLNVWLAGAGPLLAPQTGDLPQQGATVDLALMQLEAGGAATDFERRPPGVELALCQRYYATGFAGGYAGSGVNPNTVVQVVPLPVPMRASPAITYTDLAGAASRVTTANGNGFSASAGAVLALNSREMLVELILSAAPGNWWRLAWAANAEL